MDYSRHRLANGATLHLLPMRNYKTMFLGVFFYWPLGEDAAQAALVPHLLQRGDRRHPTARELRERLAGLYGSQFGIGVLKRGENLVLQFRLQLIDRDYLPGGAAVLDEVVEILRGILLEPYTEQGLFRDSYFQGEKRNVQKRIESLLNDKGRYAFQRCLQHLCPERGYSRSQYGSLQQVQALTLEAVWNQYQRLLATAPVDIYVCGRFDQDQVVEKVGACLQWQRQGEGEPEAPQPLELKEASTVRETMAINQGKLVMALNSAITQQSPLYPALVMYNGILGGYPHSKLFQIVREKHNLAYYIGSSLDSLMGLQFITAGVDSAAFGAATELIGEQLAALTAGAISQEELEWTRSSLQTGLLQMYDSMGEQVALAVDARLSRRRWTISELIAALDKVTAADVQAAAAQMNPQITYFLAGGGT